MFTVVKASGFDNATMQTAYAVVSTHPTKADAEREIARLAEEEQTARWPHRIEMRDVIADEYEIRSQ